MSSKLLSLGFIQSFTPSTEINRKQEQSKLKVISSNLYSNTFQFSTCHKSGLSTVLTCVG